MPSSGPCEPIGAPPPACGEKKGELGLVDEYQLVVHPLVVGSGLTLFKNIKNTIDLKLIDTKTFGCGSVLLDYEITKR